MPLFSEHAFLYIGLLALGFLLVYGLIRIIIGAKGSWSTSIKAHASDQKFQHSFESKGEKRARTFLESYFRAPFHKARPTFLNNDVTGGMHNMELDCFNEELKLGVEYNGRQHYEYTPFFHTSKEAFYNQKYRDKLKRIYCAERGITLIEIPYTELNRLEHWLEHRLKELGFQRK